MATPSVLLITGAAGVGKTTQGWEVSHQLARRGVAHATIDTDELDRIEPSPPLDELMQVTERNLRAMWSTYADLGHTRLLLVGVMVDLPFHLRWFGEVLGTADVRAVRLVVSDDELTARVRRREIGTGGDEQLERSLAYAAFVAAEARPDGVLYLDTDGRLPAEIAADIVEYSGWASG
jgi:hypothetical protein